MSEIRIMKRPIRIVERAVFVRRATHNPESGGQPTIQNPAGNWVGGEAGATKLPAFQGCPMKWVML